MPLPNYRDTFLQCLETLKGLTGRSEDYARFRWQAIYLTRGRFSYFFRGASDGQTARFSGQQIDLTNGEITIIPVRSAGLYGATFGLNEAITAYGGPAKSVIDVAHAFNEASEMSYQPEFFYVRMDLLHSANDSRMGRAENPRLRENTNLIFVGLEDQITADLLEESDIARWVAQEKPMASTDWYAERFYYS
ncbi:hypothetical protein N2599_04280 [Rhizobium sullae]|uniref:Uncharacterized protein n=1 Tax=Rhizobium sullae TaxID=50338 RepID=A0A2N0D337_RHISU|nr:hypothetical protein [Rhizobium sullae]PKA40499.1 hypothetical protein CWR43_28430 [Rhizobium sullae]UWU15240.1 hypothetical protein N2599_04280 [Rhizobium sullae]